MSFDNEKRSANLRYYTNESKTDLKGEYIINENTLIFGVPNVSGYKNCFKIAGQGATGGEKEMVMASDAPNIKMKWIYAVESFIMEIKQSSDRMKYLAKFAHSDSNGNGESNGSMVAQGDDEAQTLALEQKAKSMIAMVEKFLRAWMEGDMTAYSATVSASKCLYAHICLYQPLWTHSSYGYAFIYIQISISHSYIFTT